jgi:hypothetical protein
MSLPLKGKRYNRRIRRKRGKEKEKPRIKEKGVNRRRRRRDAERRGKRMEKICHPEERTCRKSFDH